MANLLNRVKMSVATAPGTGTVTLGSAMPGFQSFAAAGAVDQTTYNYVLEDGLNWEIGTGVYTASGTTLTRNPTQSSSNNAAISAGAKSMVYIDAFAADFTVAQALIFAFM